MYLLLNFRNYSLKQHLSFCTQRVHIVASLRATSVALKLHTDSLQCGLG